MGLFSLSFVERWLLNPVYKYCYWNPFSVEACDLYPAWGPGHCFPSQSPMAVLGRWDSPAALLCVAFGEGAHSAFPNCRHGRSFTLLLEPMFGVCFFRTDTAGESGFLHRPRLSRHPSLVVILRSLCWALARQLVWVAWLFVILLSTLLWQKWWPGQDCFSLSAGRERRSSPWPEQAVRTLTAGYRVLGRSIQSSNLDL